MQIGHRTVKAMLKAWDSGATIWSVECGGLGPGYEQALQVAAVEFARAAKDLKDIKSDDVESTKRFDEVCAKRLNEIDKNLCGLSGAQYGAARWLAFQWCFNGGPAALVKRCQEQERDRLIQISKAWPKL